MALRVPLTFKIFRSGQLLREEVLTQDVVKIGQLESMHLRIDDPKVSRMHAVVEVTPTGAVHLIDLGSAEGTLVNGAKVTKQALQSGDELTFGDTRIIVDIGEASAAAAVPAGSDAVLTSAPPVDQVGPSTFAPSPPVAVDPVLDRQDGSRAIEVTTMFEDTVVSVRHLDNPRSGKISGFTWSLTGLGLSFSAVGLLLLLGSAFGGLHQLGLGALITVFGPAALIAAWTQRSRELRSPHYQIGEAVEADWHVRHPALPAGAAFPLVWSTGESYLLNFSEGMTGDVTVGDERRSLDELRSSGKAQPSAEYARCHSYIIPNDARIKIDLGDNTFLISSVAPARPVIAPFLATINWPTQMANGISFAAHAMLLFLVFAIPPDAKSLSTDLFNADSKFLKFLIKPPEEKDDKLPAWLKRSQEKAGGKGQAHKGSSGKMGKKTSNNKRGLYGLKGPKNNPDPHLAKRLAEDLAENAGVLGVIKAEQGSHLASIFGRETALGSDAQNVLGGLTGNQLGEAYGVNGLGLVGSGRGGGGTGEGTIGTGRLATIGKGGGGGTGAGYGRGAGQLAGRRAKAPRVLAGRAEVRGALDKEIIRRIIRRHINEVKYCYAKELMANPNLGGRVIIQFTIAATGQVASAFVQSSTLGNKTVELCIAKAVRRWLFPKPKGGGIVIVSYPFVLQAPQI